jgi:ankyrin repeat protein
LWYGELPNPLFETVFNKQSNANKNGDSYGALPKFAAAYNEQDRKARLPIGSHANVADNRVIQLCPAVWKGKIDVVKHMINSGANVNQKDTDGDNQTPLHVAAKLGSFEIAKLRVESGANIN